jgi:hypothetical protein
VADFRLVSASYFRALGLRLRRGRTLSERDRDNTPLVAVINETMARTFFGADDPIGQRLLMVFGVISYSVVQRTQEIGIRAALGATPAHLVALVVGGGMASVAFGLAAGTVTAFGSTRLLSSVLFGISPSDPTTLIAALSMLAAVAIPSNHRDTRAVPPFIARSTSASVAMLVSPGVVIASAPWAAPHSTAHRGPRSVISP